MKFASSIWLQVMSVICMIGMAMTPGCTGTPSVLGNQVLKEVAITGPNALAETDTNYFGVVASYEDGSTMQVFTNLSWTVSEGPGTISDIGFYTAPETVTEETPVTLRVALTQDGVTREATKSIKVAKKNGNLPTLKIEGPDSAEAGKDATFKLIATTKDGTATDVTAQGIWSVYGGPGTFANPGTFTAPSMVTENTLTTVVVNYTTNGTTLQSSKVITITPAGVPAKMLTALTVNGPETVDQGKTASYQATATYNDASTADVTTQASWTLGNNVGTIQTGAYTAPATVTADTPVMIKVSLTENSTTVESSKAITVKAPVKTVTALAVKGPEVVGQGETAKYLATATYSDASTADVTSQTNWAVVENLGTIQAGAYTAPATVTADMPVTIEASLDNQKASQKATLTTIGVKKISGQIYDAAGKFVPGVIVKCTYNNLSYTTDAAGYYSFRVAYGWSGTITPQPTTQYTFTPASKTYQNVKLNMPSQNYTAGAGVPGENQIPVANQASLSTQTGTPANLTLTGSDPDGDALTYAVMIQPAHGTLSGTIPNLVYSPTAGYTGSDSFSFKVNDGTVDSLPAMISIQVESVPLPPPTNTGDFVPPIGIPAPSFGINETNNMFATARYDFGNGLEAYRNAGDGPYTHYVDNTSSNSTDTSNAFGTKDRPRKTIPTAYLKAGSVVEIHGGPYSASVMALCGNGTKAAPVIFRGPTNGPKPVLNGSFRLRGSYIIGENFDLNNAGLTWSTGAPISNASLRYCDIHGGGGLGINVASFSGDQVTNIVLYKNKVHDKGNLASTTDEDATGIAVNWGVSYCWILDNEIYNTSGSGIQILAGSLAKMSTVNHIYVGRNLVYRARQSGIWSKESVDCVFSQNTVHSIINTSWSPSKGLGFQYGPERLWIIYNHVYDCTFGIAAHSSGSSTSQEAFIVGNLIHDIHHANDGTNFFAPNSGWSNAGIMLVGVPKHYIVNNTIYNVDAGINSPGPNALYMENNIISNVTVADCQHVYIQSSPEKSWMKNCLFYQNGQDVRIRWGSTKYTLPTFQSATGKAINCSNADPKFVNIAGDDFHLQSTSPAINKGLTSQVYDRFQTLHGVDIRKDLESTIRPLGGTWDIGAYEFKQ
jgi:hypothetical protein